MGRYEIDTDDSKVVSIKVIGVGGGGIWVRPAKMWDETIERDGKTFKRFEYIGE